MCEAQGRDYRGRYRIIGTIDTWQVLHIWPLPKVIKYCNRANMQRGNKSRKTARKSIMGIA